MRYPPESPEEISDYVRQIYRPPAVNTNHFVACLDRLGLFTPSTTLVEIATGPSPHIGWHLCSRFKQGEMHFVDWSTAALSVHKLIYRQLVPATPFEKEST